MPMKREAWEKLVRAMHATEPDPDLMALVMPHVPPRDPLVELVDLRPRPTIRLAVEGDETLEETGEYTVAIGMLAKLGLEVRAFLIEMEAVPEFGTSKMSPSMVDAYRRCRRANAEATEAERLYDARAREIKEGPPALRPKRPDHVPAQPPRLRSVDDTEVAECQGGDEDGCEFHPVRMPVVPAPTPFDPGIVNIDHGNGKVTQHAIPRHINPSGPLPPGVVIEDPPYGVPGPAMPGVTVVDVNLFDNTKLATTVSGASNETEKQEQAPVPTPESLPKTDS